jgi:hypothetical protein
MSNRAINNLNKQSDMLKVLVHCKEKLRKVILKNADRDLVDAICQCINNLLIGNLDISESDKKELHKYRHILRKLVKKSTLKQKQKILVQKGGFLQYLIPAAITGISQIISSLVSNKD